MLFHGIVLSFFTTAFSRFNGKFSGLATFHG
jgi:hypothetical protein